jgi:hypothetical protein
VEARTVRAGVAKEIISEATSDWKLARLRVVSQFEKEAKQARD